jgi:hypothetical protein
MRQVCGLVDPHQRRVDQEAVVHAEGQRHLQRLHGVVAAVGVAGKVGFADAGDEDLDAAPVGQRRGQREEQQVAPGHEGVGQAAGFHAEGHVAVSEVSLTLPSTARSSRWSSPRRSAQAGNCSRSFCSTTVRACSSTLWRWP